MPLNKTVLSSNFSFKKTGQLFEFPSCGSLFIWSRCKSFSIIFFVINLIFGPVFFGELPHYSQSKLSEHRSLCFEALWLSSHCSWHKGKLHICASEHPNSPAQFQSPLTLVLFLLPVVFAVDTPLITRKPCLGQMMPIIRPYRTMYLSFVALSQLLFDGEEYQ